MAKLCGKLELAKFWNMASFCRPRSSRAVWSIEESALFAARKEFELLRLLATDKAALTTARRLGYLVGGRGEQPHPQSTTTQSRQPARSRAAGDTTVPANRDRRQGRPDRPARPNATNSKRDIHLCPGFQLNTRLKCYAHHHMGPMAPWDEACIPMRT